MGDDPISGYAPNPSGTGGVWGMSGDLGNRRPEAAVATSRRPVRPARARPRLLACSRYERLGLSRLGHLVMRPLRALLATAAAALAAMALTSSVLAQWPTTCVDLNDIVEAHLGNDGNVGIYQRVFGDQAEQGCQNDHRDDVRGVFAWAFDDATQSATAELPDLAWPTDCVELNDIVEAHLGNDGNVGIYQRAFAGAAEFACRGDHRDDVRGVFAWAFGGAVVVSQDQPASIAAGWSSVAVGAFHNCAIRTDGTVACWGLTTSGSGFYFGQSNPPAGLFQSVSAGLHHTCGVQTNGALMCWGSNIAYRDSHVGQATPPPGRFQSVSAGIFHTCGVRIDGTVACWGDNTYSQAGPPSETFRSVSAGANHTCGVRTDGTVTCWGSNRTGQTTPPTGTFQSVNAGQHHTCGVRADGTVACWGSNVDNWNRVVGQSTPPAGTFRSVSAGLHHTCGVRTDQTVACWGSNNERGLDFVGQSITPAGSFAAVGAGHSHTCVLKTDGTLACWGWNGHGQTSPPT